MDIERQSRFSFAETISRLTASIAATGSTVFATIDQAAAAAGAGLALRPTTLIVFGNPKGGTPLMDAFPLMALELPLKVVVWEHDGVVSLACGSMTETAARYGVTGRDAAIAAMDAALLALLNSVA